MKHERTLLLACCAVVVVGGVAAGCGDDGPPSTTGPVTTASGGSGPATTTATGGVGGDGAGGEGEGGRVSLPFCGDGVVQAGEGCDDGNNDNDDACPDDVINGGTCQPARCGDGHVWSGNEVCDDGNGDNADDCPDGMGGTCEPASCSDGHWHHLESGDEVDVDCGGSCGPCPGGLLLSELVLGPVGSQLVELYNPGLFDVPLDDLYLADYASYYLITEGGGAPDPSDFRLRFPPGHVVPAGRRVVVSLASATAFTSAFGRAPDFDLDGADAGAPAMLGEFTNISRFGTTQEMLVLFHWDGASELVTDVDYVVWGGPVAAMDKSGVTVGGSTYQPETPVAMQSAASAPPANQALVRCLYGEGLELDFGGNGFAGADETSEDHANTWRIAPPSPGASNRCPTLAAIERGDLRLVYLDRQGFAELQALELAVPQLEATGAVAIAQSPVTGAVFVVVKDVNTGRHLAQLNLATGRARVVGELADSVAALAFDAAGTLFAMTGDGGQDAETLFTIDTNTAAMTSVLSLPTQACCGEALAFNPSDGLLYRFTGLDLPFFQSIDPTLPDVLDLAHVGAAPAEATGAVWDPAAGRFMVFDGALGVLTVAPDGTTVDTGATTATKLRGAVIP